MIRALATEWVPVIAGYLIGYRATLAVADHRTALAVAVGSGFLAGVLSDVDDRSPRQDPPELRPLSEYAGRGLMDCPECDLTIIGAYGDLKRHIRGSHPLTTLYVRDGRALLERIADAQSRALQRNVDNHMIVSEDGEGDG